jgi:acyl carrier protein
MKSLETRVISVLSRAAMLPEQELAPARNLVEIGIRSLEQIECIMALEDEFRLELPDQDLRGLRTVQDVIDLVRDALTRSARGPRTA